jgi:branched-chain amino acid aminotransferase group I
MYAFASHPLVGEVLDEPLYGRHMLQNPHLPRPYTQQLLQSQPYSASLDQCYKVLSAPTPTPSKPIKFIKHMAKQAPTLEIAKIKGLAALGKNLTVDGGSPPKPTMEKLLAQDRHILLLRDPLKVISSFAKNSPASLEEIGLADLTALYDVLTSSGAAWASSNVVIVDSDQLTTQPERTLSAIMRRFNLPFDEAMLRWPAGPKAYDGCWAFHWYASVHKSTSFSAAASLPSYKTLTRAHLDLYKTCLPLYLSLKTRTINPPCDDFLNGNDLYTDPRNASVLYFMGASNEAGNLYPRDLASISPFDSAVQGGDAAWEGIRIYNGKVFKLDRHLKRLFDSAKALDFKNVHTKEQVVQAIFQTLAANGIRDQGHIRLTLTRGKKCTSSMNPNFNVYGTTLIVLAEWKSTEDRTTYDNTKGIKLISASGRRNGPDCVDSKIHHNNLINNILPKIQANYAGAADALMLGCDGFVSETNATNVFCVRNGVVMTPAADYCLPGITRESILLICREQGIPHMEGRISLVEFITADEVFTSGTMGELTPVTEIDYRVVGDGKRGEMTARLQEIYKTLPDREGWATSIPPFE